MHWYTDLKVCYATLLVLLQVWFVNSAVDTKMSSMLANSEDLRSLELCTMKNQQRLGSVYGNFTRHHKKGHRRRTTTTPTTIAETTENGFTTTYSTTTEHIINRTILKLPKPLRLSSSLLDTDYTEEILNLDKVDDEIQEMLAKERRHSKHYKEKELVEELSEKSLSDNVNKVKKMYRESTASNANRLSAKGKGGIFLTENCTTVIAQIGTTAILHCEVSDITENTVTWIRRKDYSLLSVGLVTYSADNRFFSAHGRHVKDWALHIRFATSADAGYYECQVPTHPPTSIFFKLILVAAYAEIMGESEKIIHEGSMLRLVCVVRRSTEPPSYVFWYFENRMINYDLTAYAEIMSEAEKIIHEGSMLRLVCVVRRSTEPPSYVFWYFENRMINYDLNGVSVHNGRQTSELVIGKAEPRHAGNYTCVPANAKATSVTVHVIQSETPAAMQHGNNSSCSENKVHFTTIALIISLVAIRIASIRGFQEIG